MSKVVVLFDDERSFQAGFRDDALVARSVEEAVELFKSLKGKIIDELWLDYVLSPGATTDALYALDGVTVNAAYFHSTAYMALELVEVYLKKAGIDTSLEISDRSMFD